MNLRNYLKNLVKRGFLKKEEIGIDQIRALLSGASKNILSAQKNLEIDEETCYTMAYNSMIKVARALLFLQGLRPDDGQQHKTTVDVAGKILGAEFKNLINQFDNMRKKRNVFTYDPLAPLSYEETKNATETAKSFYNKVQKFLEKTNPQKKLF